MASVRAIRIRRGRRPRLGGADAYHSEGAEFHLEEGDEAVLDAKAALHPKKGKRKCSVAFNRLLEAEIQLGSARAQAQAVGLHGKKRTDLIREVEAFSKDVRKLATDVKRKCIRESSARAESPKKHKKAGTGAQRVTLSEKEKRKAKRTQKQLKKRITYE